MKFLLKPLLAMIIINSIIFTGQSQSREQTIINFDPPNKENKGENSRSEQEYQKILAELLSKLETDVDSKMKVALRAITRYTELQVIRLSSKNANEVNVSSLKKKNDYLKNILKSLTSNLIDQATLTARWISGKENVTSIMGSIPNQIVLDIIPDSNRMSATSLGIINWRDSELIPNPLRSYVDRFAKFSSSGVLILKKAAEQGIEEGKIRKEEQTYVENYYSNMQSITDSLIDHIISCLCEIFSQSN